LSALRRQSGCELEVVVVDNASTDGSAGVVRESLPEFKLLVLDRNVGFAAGNNAVARGRRRCSGDRSPRMSCMTSRGFSATFARDKEVRGYAASWRAWQVCRESCASGVRCTKRLRFAPESPWSWMERDWIGVGRREKAFSFRGASGGSARAAP
jgi:glycosyltransferase involved in cell wall biosynthesis